MSTPPIVTDVSRNVASLALNQSNQNTQTGNFNGVALKVVNMASVIANAQEELSFSFQGKVGADLAQRKVLDSKAESNAQLEKIEKLLTTMFSAKKLDQITGMVKRLTESNFADEAKLNRLLERFNVDRNEQYIALMGMRRMLLKGQGTHVLTALKLVNAKIAQFEGATDIKVAKETATKGVSDIRSEYHDAVVNFVSLSDVWHKLVNMFGRKRWKKAKKYLLNALADEYEMSGSDVDGNRLASIMADMNRIKMLSAVYESCEETALILGYKG